MSFNFIGQRSELFVIVNFNFVLNVYVLQLFGNILPGTPTSPVFTFLNNLFCYICLVNTVDSAIVSLLARTNILRFGWNLEHLHPFLQFLLCQFARGVLFDLFRMGLARIIGVRRWSQLRMPRYILLLILNSVPQISHVYF